MSRLSIFAIDLTGAAISDVEIELTPVGNPRRAIKTDRTELQVLYGDYQLRIHSTGSALASRELRISQPEMLVRLELPVASIGCPPPPAEIGGRVKRGSVKGDIWVKAVPLRGVGGGEDRINNSGYFLISGLEYSTYLVTVMQGETILRQQIVKTYPVGSANSRLEIDLAGPNK